MTDAARLILLDSPGTPDGVFRMYADRVDARKLAEGKRESVVTVTRMGEFQDPRYPKGVQITREKLLAMIDNFNAGVVGREIFINKAHNPNEGAAGTIRKLFLDQGKLRALVEWTEFGVELVKKFGFRYLSAEFHEDWQDNETGETHGPTLLGAGLTIVPVVRRTEPVQLSEQSLFECPTYLTDRILKLLSEECEQTMNKFLKKLREKLAAKKLSDPIITQLAEAFQKAGEHVGDDEERLEKLLSQFIETGESLAKQLAEASNPGEIKLSIEIPEPAGDGDDPKAKALSKEDVEKILADAQKAAADQQKQLQENKDANVKTFSDAIDAAEGLKDLDEKTLGELKDCADLITAEMTPEQVTKLAERQIAWGEKLLSQQKLAARGFDRGGAGSVRVIKPEEEKQVVALQEQVDQRMGFTDMSDSERYEHTGGSLPDRNKKLAEEVLAKYDADNERRLSEEYKLLAGGDGKISDVEVPSFFERTVIREALYMLMGPQFCNTGTAPYAESISIPYSFRDTTAAGKNDTRTYESQGIKRAGVRQATELAYPIPQKLAFLISNELMRLTRSSIYDWDAVAENARNAGRIIGEDTERLVFNGQLQANHEYGAIDVADEDLELQADGTKRVFVLANFPVVRPKSLYDLQGNQIGNTQHPITVTYDSVAREEYDGTGTQAAGIYYVLDYDLGEIYLVDEAGAIQTPADATAYTISYSYATNVFKFDTDEGSLSTEDKWDQFLYRYGLRKTTIQDERFHMANYGLMSETYANQVEQAKRFAANFRRPGTDLSADGSLGRIKGVPNFNTSAPGLWMGDRYALIGERGVTRFRMMQAWSMGQLENARNSDGEFTAEKEAYGEQTIVVHTPSQLKRATTAIMLYSATDRVARANP